jgi:hypothetical protein
VEKSPRLPIEENNSIASLLVRREFLYNGKGQEEMSEMYFQSPLPLSFKMLNWDSASWERNGCI